MSVEVKVRDLGSAIEVALAGVVDRPLLDRLGEALKAVSGSDKPTIVNLDNLTLLDREGLDPPADRLSSGFDGEVALVCRRTTSVEQLRRWGVDRMVPIHRSLDAALERAALERAAVERAALERSRPGPAERPPPAGSAPAGGT